MIPVHLLGVIGVVYVARHWEWTALLEIWLGWFVFGCLGVEIGLHREFAHRTVGLESQPMRWLLGWLACMADVALSVFNDAIIRCAGDAGVPVIDLRRIFRERADYANPIEPSAIGGAKMVKAIAGVAAAHDFTARRTSIWP